MGDVTIVREQDGKAKIHKDSNSYIFSKDGVYFKLNEKQLHQTKALIEGLLDGSLVNVQSVDSV